MVEGLSVLCYATLQYVQEVLSIFVIENYIQGNWLLGGKIKKEEGKKKKIVSEQGKCIEIASSWVISLFLFMVIILHDKVLKKFFVKIVKL